MAEILRNSYSNKGNITEFYETFYIYIILKFKKFLAP